MKHEHFVDKRDAVTNCCHSMSEHRSFCPMPTGHDITSSPRRPS